MRLTGDQVRKLAELSDGAAVSVTKKVRGDAEIIVHRLEDGLRVKVDSFGFTETLHDPSNEDA